MCVKVQLCIHFLTAVFGVAMAAGLAIGAFIEVVFIGYAGLVIDKIAVLALIS